MTSGSNPVESAGHLKAEELSRLADGEQLAEARAGHARDCADCANELAAWRALSRGAGSLGSVPMPPGLETRVLAALRNSGGDELPAWLAWWGRPWGLVTAALLLLAATLGTPHWLAPEPSLPVDWAWAAGLPSSPGPAGSETGDDLVLDPLEDAESDPASSAGDGR